MRSSPPGLSAVVFFPEVLPRIQHGFNTDTMQAGKELVPVNYGRGGTRAMALEHREITEQIVEFKRFVFGTTPDRRLGVARSLALLSPCSIRVYSVAQVAVCNGYYQLRRR
jgi:hypothetical protein